MDYREIIIDGVGTASMGLCLISCYMPMPEPQTNYVLVPGSSGALDLTDYFGHTCYSNRDGLEYVFDYMGDYVAWAKMVEKVAQVVHGRKAKLVIDADPNFYYIARLLVNPKKINDRQGTVTITGTADPFKYKMAETKKQLQLSSAAASINLTNLFAPVVPLIKTTAATKLSFRGKIIDLGVGSYRIPDIMLEAGDNLISASGSGTITFTYQEAGL